jgi:putative ABC transport system permease protein
MARLRYAIRSLSKSPLLCLTVALSLGLGIGSNTAIFSLMHQAILASLPVAHPEELAIPTSPSNLKDGRVSSNDAGHADHVFSYPVFRALELHPEGLTAIAAFRKLPANLAFRNQTVHGDAMVVSGRYFSLLGVQPEIGRILTPADDVPGAGNPVAVLSYDYWSGPLGAQLDALNQPIRVNGHIFTIVGVAPRGFNGVTFGDQSDVFVPLTFKPLLTPGWNGTDHYDDYWLYLVARRNAGYSLKQSQDALNGVYHSAMELQSSTLHLNAKPAANLLASKLELHDGSHGNSSLRDSSRTPIFILIGATAMVLLIAMANAANLLLARSAQRKRELAIRAAIGANRAELMAQLLTEAMLLAAGGALAGFAIASFTLRFLVAQMGNGDSPVQFLTTHLEWPVLIYGIGLALVTGLVCGFYPAWDAARTSAAATLKDAAGHASSGRGVSRVRRGLVCAQVMVSAALLIPTGLFLKSLVNLTRVDLGLKTDRVVTFGISPERNGYSFDACRTLLARAESDLAAIPGVTAVTDDFVGLIAGDNWGNSITIPGVKLPNMNAKVDEVGPGFFADMGIPLIAGREFSESDNLSAEHVAVVNQEFVKQFYDNRNPLGQQFRIGEDPPMTIVGVSRNSHYSAVKEDLSPVYYAPWRQDKQLGGLTFYLRSALPEDQTMAQARRVIRSIDANLPLEGLRTLDAQVAQSTRNERLILQLSGAFAILATALAMLGLYGVMAFSVTRRTREIGIRLALGAKPASIRGMVIREMLWILGIGLAIGIPAALALGRLTESQLYGVKSFDWSVLTCASLMLGVTAIAAAFLPANRAAGVSPTVALRYE